MTTVWVLVHEHRHGTELSVHRTRKGALAAAMRPILDSLDDVDPALRRRLEDLIARGEYEVALIHWQSNIGTPEGRVLRIEERPLLA